MNINWTRWINASINQHFVDQSNIVHVSDYNNEVDIIPLVVEDQNIDTTDYKDWAELRIEGPIYTQATKGEWEINAVVNILLLSTINDLDLYRPKKFQGIIQNAFVNMMLYEYGDGGSELGCFELQGSVVTKNFGQVEPSVKILQSSVEGAYKIFLME